MAKPKPPELLMIAELRDHLTQLRMILPSLSKPAAKKAMAELFVLTNEMENAHCDLDPIKDPGASFDPSDPKTAGRLVALALVVQDKVPLDRIARTYGSGVYAIYYSGDHPAYAPLSQTEHPIYIGKADPKESNARTSREQGPQLYNRLNDHRRMIKKVSEFAINNNLPHPLHIEDFMCRRLVCATNAQLVAERHLIGTFRPLWNKEMNICWGISKHGDDAKKRSNKRSPWDVMHPGRDWAMDEILKDKKSPEVIAALISDHFEKSPPYRRRGRIVRDLLAEFIQNGPIIQDNTVTVYDAAPD